ncbi:MAG: hypothetical protein ABR511_10945 [Acidimicrobiales bacterium]
MGRLNADGSRDTRFGTNGVVLASERPEMSAATSFAPLADGRVLVGGWYAPPTVLGPSDVGVIARYTATGQLDTTFGTGGTVTTDLDTPYVDRGTDIAALAVQPDGRIVAVGSVQTWYAGGGMPIPGQPVPVPAMRHESLRNVALMRYLPDGRLDTTFAGTGTVITRVAGRPNPDYHDSSSIIVPEAASLASALAFDGAGDILVGGWSHQPSAEPLVLRYTPSGLLDTTFGDRGALVVDLGGPSGWIDAVAVGPDGRVSAAGATRFGLPEAPNYADVLVGRVDPGGSAGTVWAWGWNGVGQLGDGTTVDRHLPVPVGGLSGVVGVSAGPYHTLAVRGDGTVWAWGWNAFGQIGDGTTVDRHAPVRVPGLSGIVAVAAGGLHSLALGNDGTVWAWGWNGVGQLGDGTTVSRPRPTRVRQLAGAISISAGLYHSVALREEGSAWSWGWNGTGQLGDGTTVDRHLPTRLPALYADYAYQAVSAGWLHNVAVNVEGVSEVWGWNGVGQISLFPGGTVTPPANTFGGPYSAPAGGGYHSLMLQPDGTVRAAGWNVFGQLGAGTTSNGGGERVVPGLADVASLAAGGAHNLALTRDRTLWAWGFNGEGQLGLGTTATALSPTKVSSLANVAFVAAGGYHTVAIEG